MDANFDKYIKTGKNMNNIINEAYQEDQANPFDQKLAQDVQQNIPEQMPQKAYFPIQGKSQVSTEKPVEPVDTAKEMQPIYEQMGQVENKAVENLMVADDMKQAASEIEENAAIEYAANQQMLNDELQAKKAVIDQDIQSRVKKEQDDYKALISSIKRPTENKNLALIGFLEGFSSGLLGQKSNFGAWLNEYRSKSQGEFLKRISDLKESGNKIASQLLSNGDKLKKALDAQYARDLDLAKSQMVAKAKASKSPIEKAKTIEAISKINKEIEMARTSAKEKATVMAMEQRNREFEKTGSPIGAIVKIKDIKSPKDREVVIPIKNGNAILARDSKGAQEVSGFVAAADDFKKTIKEYIALKNKYGSRITRWISNPVDAPAEFKTLGARMIAAAGKYSEAGVIQPSEVERFNKLLPSSDRVFTSTGLKQLNVFKKALDDRLRSKIKSVTGKDISIEEIY